MRSLDHGVGSRSRFFSTSTLSKSWKGTLPVAITASSQEQGPDDDAEECSNHTGADDKEQRPDGDEVDEEKVSMKAIRELLRNGLDVKDI